MTEKKYYQQDTDLWRELIDQEKTYLLTRQNFLNSPSRAELIKLALQNPLERATALKIINYLTNEELQSLFTPFPPEEYRLKTAKTPRTQRNQIGNLTPGRE